MFQTTSVFFALEKNQNMIVFKILNKNRLWNVTKDNEKVNGDEDDDGNNNKDNDTNGISIFWSLAIWYCLDIEMLGYNDICHKCSIIPQCLIQHIVIACCYLGNNSLYDVILIWHLTGVTRRPNLRNGQITSNPSISDLIFKRSTSPSRVGQGCIL